MSNKIKRIRENKQDAPFVGKELPHEIKFKAEISLLKSQMKDDRQGWVSFEYSPEPRPDNPTPFTGTRLVNLGADWTPGKSGEGFMDYADPRVPTGKPYRVARIRPGTIKVITPPTKTALAAYFKAKEEFERKGKQEKK